MRNIWEGWFFFFMSSLHLHVQSCYQGSNLSKLLSRASKVAYEIPRCPQYGPMESKSHEDT